MTTKIDHFIDRSTKGAIFIHPKSRALGPIERFPMRRERLALTGEDVVSKHFKSPAGGNRGIKLANRSRCGIAWIRKSRLTRFFAFGIDALKNPPAQVG